MSLPKVGRRRPIVGSSALTFYTEVASALSVALLGEACGAGALTCAIFAFIEFIS